MITCGRCGTVITDRELSKYIVGHVCSNGHVQYNSATIRNNQTKETENKMQITKDSHTDHLTSDQIGYLADLFAGRDKFFIERVELPPELGATMCGLYGPIMGDAPISDAEVSFGKRAGRTNDSRLVRRPKRPTSFVTVIAGPHEGTPCILYTAFGGPLSPKEPSDPTIKPEELEASKAFWAEHALAVDDEIPL